LVWHDGKKFSAKDLTDYQLKGATFSAVNDQTLKVNLHESYAPFLTILSQPKIRPNLIGLGSYKTNRMTMSDDIIKELDLKPLMNNLPFLTYKFYPTISAALLGFKLGEVDKLENIADIQDLKFERNIKISEITLYDRYVAIFFNLKDSFFKEKEIRQALNYALPKFEGFEKTYTPISPLSWAYSSKIRLYNSDPETAQKILSKSSISSSSAQLTLSTFAPLLDKAEIIADAWNKIGLSVKVKVENSFPSDYQLLLLTQIIPPDPDQYQYWQSTQENTNITHYNNPKIDKLLEDGRKTLETDARKKIYADFQRYLVDDAPVIFLYYPKVYTVERSSKM
jgi:peptide/nickel transport system substrate-binding protein